MKMLKETIFIFIYGYIPGMQYGGLVTSIYNFSEYFGDKYDVRIVCSNHDYGLKEVYSDIKPGWNPVGKANVLYLSEAEYKTKKFYTIMELYPVKMIYLTGVFSYRLNHAAIKASKKLHAPIVIATRGEILKNILAIKKYKKVPYLWLMKKCGEFRNIYFQITSDEEHEQLVKYLDIPENHIIMLPNIHGNSFHCSNLQKVQGAAKILFISRIHPKKNLIDAVKAAVKVEGKLEFDIYGPIEDEIYWEECQKVIKTAPDNVRIHYCGALNMEEAKESYYRYHAFLFPTLSENYGHVIVEAMIDRCPIIISKGTTPWDDINGKGGFVIDLHDIDALKNAIEKVILMDFSKYALLQKSVEEYCKDKLKLKELLEKYQKMINQEFISTSWGGVTQSNQVACIYVVCRHIEKAVAA